MEQKRNNNSIARKSFAGAFFMLAALLVFSVVLTYVLSDASKVPVMKGILAPVLVFFSDDGLSLLFLSLFIMTISAIFNVMQEQGGVRAVVNAVAKRFENKRLGLVVIMSFLFYSFGAFLGLFEEMITLMPIVCAICLSIGFDSFTGFMCSILSCGFGFASAVTNPFTVILASDIIGVNPMKHIGFRLLIFVMMFLLLQCFIFLYVRKIKKNPGCSLTAGHDKKSGERNEEGRSESSQYDEKKLVKAYTAFFAGSLILIVASSAFSATRGITVVLITAYTLVFGMLTAFFVSKDMKKVLKSMLGGLLGALPAIVFIAFAASVKYVFEEGKILPLIIDNINRMADGKKDFTNALCIFAIVLVLEFFISSSTAKALIVMEILAMASTGLSKPMMVLLYTFGDGYTNVLFPTSPVLLISLSMLDVEYFKWLKKGAPLFIFTFMLVIGFIALGIFAGY